MHAFVFSHTFFFCIVARYSIPSVLPHGSAVRVVYPAYFQLNSHLFMALSFLYLIALYCLHTNYTIYTVYKLLYSFGIWRLIPWLVYAVYPAPSHRLALYIYNILYIIIYFVLQYICISTIHCCILESTVSTLYFYTEVYTYYIISTLLYSILTYYLTLT